MLAGGKWTSHQTGQRTLPLPHLFHLGFVICAVKNPDPLRAILGSDRFINGILVQFAPKLRTLPASPPFSAPCRGGHCKVCASVSGFSFPLQLAHRASALTSFVTQLNQSAIVCTKFNTLGQYQFARKRCFAPARWSGVRRILTHCRDLDSTGVPKWGKSSLESNKSALSLYKTWFGRSRIWPDTLKASHAGSCDALHGSESVDKTTPYPVSPNTN